MSAGGSATIGSPASIVRLRLYPAGHRADVPKEFALLQNFPNPFNPSTVIRYTLPIQSEVSLKIYNVMGQVVRTLVEGVRESGEGQVEWNSTNDAGFAVSSGVYFFRIDAAGLTEPQRTFTQVRKMLLLK